MAQHVSVSFAYVFVCAVAERRYSMNGEREQRAFVCPSYRRPVVTLYFLCITCCVRPTFCFWRYPLNPPPEIASLLAGSQHNSGIPLNYLV